MSKNYYNIEKTDYGIRLIFCGMLKVNDIRDWCNEFIELTNKLNGAFTVFVDMRTLVPLSKDSQIIMEEGQKHARKTGMNRSAVILNNPITTMQFKRIAQETGIFEGERYIDASTNPDWEQLGLDWLVNAKDPNPKTAKLSIG